MQVNTNINYTEKMVTTMHKVYTAEPTRKTKTGEPIVRKAELVAQIESYFEDEMPSLVKATKADLQKLVEKL